MQRSFPLSKFTFLLSLFKRQGSNFISFDLGLAFPLSSVLAIVIPRKQTKRPSHFVEEEAGVRFKEQRLPSHFVEEEASVKFKQQRLLEDYLEVQKVFMEMLYRNLLLGRKSCRQQNRREKFFWLKFLERKAYIFEDAILRT